MSKVVILIFHHSAHLKWFERISLLQCFNVLGDHPIRLVCPEGTNVDEFRKLVPEIEVDPVPAHWMNSIREYNRMKVSPSLYNRYRDYEYMLTYELDAFVFRDELAQWCEQGYDYIGAPWVTRDEDGEPELTGVGNSGFSLRNIQSALKVMNSFGWVKSPWGSAKRSWARGQKLQALGKLLAMTTIYNNTHRWLMRFFIDHEDGFWSSVGHRRPSFKLASNQKALAFSIEKEPAWFLEQLGGNLPFGCHAWQKYQPDAWRRHIEACGYDFPDAKGAGVSDG
ncbi:hypothetical protein LF1_23530 [Rubripirellula obstinata]|uniref:DUF5672 domain-containing protein n=1 Tax=Rubripirellula obstinata TaxID=406547 RepID=A0A5B1CGY2_9BACT|nr:DUF5672 family protein [Rubripirellula obstinata]KAA1259816.1 hypothetical protein LF1_23530 [Rubripirellula obstinata]